MASVNKSKKYCVKCDDNENRGGLFTCDGCQNMYCIRHVHQHREELNNQLETVGHEYNLIKQQLSQPSSDHVLFEHIDHWERKTILTIQKIADTIRCDLQQLIDRSNQRASKLCEDISTNIGSARQKDNFSELDLQEWKEKLDEIKTEINSSTPCSLIQDKRPTIHLIKIQTNSVTSNDLSINSLDTTKDKFGEIYGPVQLGEANMSSDHIGDDGSYGRICGYMKYSRDRSTVRFQIERSTCPEQLFFGITTLDAEFYQRLWGTSSTVGWCGDNNLWQHGAYNRLSDQSPKHKFQMRDVLSLTFDCNQKQIEFYNQRTDVRWICCVDLTQTPFPWQFLIGLRNIGDCVTIV